jgi:hypothetical protein
MVKKWRGLGKPLRPPNAPRSLDDGYNNDDFA